MKYFIYLFMLATTFLSCSSSHEQERKKIFGVDFNIERQKVGLQLLGDNWIQKSLNDTILIEWYSPDGDIKKFESKNDTLKYWAKFAFVNGDTIFREIDIYVNQQDTIKEKLFYIYSFLPHDDFDDIGWSYFHQQKNMKYFNIKKIEADSILKKWRDSDSHRSPI